MLKRQINSDKIVEDLKKPGISLYYRIAEYMRNKIESGEWPEGHQLLSEPDLAEYFRVSRSTVRQAIADLIADGLLVRRRGLGTFVATPFRELNYIHYLLPEAFGNRHRVISVTHLPASPSLGRYLELDPGSTVTEIFRARFICDEKDPSLLEKSYYSHALFPDLEKTDLTGKIYDHIANEYGIPLVQAKTFIEPVTMTVEEATTLHCSPDQLAILLTRICYTTPLRPIILTKKIVRTDRFKLCVEDRITLSAV